MGLAEPRLIDLPNPPASIKKLLACMTALGMNPSVYGGGEDSILIFGKRDDLKLACQARYTIGVTPKGAKSAKFDGAKVHDPVGIVENLEADYYYNKPEMKSQGILPQNAERIGQERSARYNDGAQWRKMVADFSTAGKLNEWLDEWIDLLKVDHKKQSAVRKAKPTEFELLKGADWRG